MFEIVVIFFLFLVIFMLFLAFVVFISSLALWLATRYMNFYDQSFGKAVHVIVRYSITNTVASIIFTLLYPIIGGLIAMVIPASIVKFIIVIFYILLSPSIFMYIVTSEYGVNITDAFKAFLICYTPIVLLLGLVFAYLSLQSWHFL